VFTTIGAALGQPTARQDRVPVRRQSRLAGRCEGLFWRRTDRQEVRRIVLAARKYDLAGRQPGRANGPLGHVALEVLELLGHIVDYKTGCLEPAITYLMRKLRRSRDAVVRALGNLRAHGFLDWLRRFQMVERDGPGPRVRQITNAYRMTLPARAARLLMTSPDKVISDDISQHIEDQRQDLLAMKADLPLEEFAVLEVDDGPLGRALAQMARSIQRRESAGQTEPMAKIFL
jgi:hypothetical protein